MTTWRMLGPSNVQNQTMTVNGRTYSAGAGQPLDIQSGDAATLQANRWIFVAPSGPTSSRPTGGPDLQAGARFYDTTIDDLIFFDGATWRDPTSGDAV